MIQQRAGVHLKGGVGETGDRYEQHADEVADRVVRGESSEALLDQFADPAAATGEASVQKKPIDPSKLGAVGAGKLRLITQEVTDTDQLSTRQLADLISFLKKTSGAAGKLELDVGELESAHGDKAKLELEQQKLEKKKDGEKDEEEKPTVKVSVDHVPPPPSHSQEESTGPAKKGKSQLDILEEYGLSGDEVAAIQLYTTSTYILINKYLRGIANERQRHEIAGFAQRSSVRCFADINEDSDSKSIFAAFDRFIALIVSGMKKVPEYSEKSMVSRGADLEEYEERPWTKGLMKQYEPGRMVVDAGFLSTTFATPFAKDSLIILKLPTGHGGRDLAWLSKFEQEKEILFPPGTSFKVERIVEKKDTETFKKLFEQLVQSEEERVGRFKVVNRVIEGHVVTPEEQQTERLKQDSNTRRNTDFWGGRGGNM